MLKNDAVNLNKFVTKLFCFRNIPEVILHKSKV
jgi:hypothetical protein